MIPRVTVGDLLDALRDLPPHLPVVLDPGDGGWYELARVVVDETRVERPDRARQRPLIMAARLEP